MLYFSCKSRFLNSSANRYNKAPEAKNLNKGNAYQLMLTTTHLPSKLKLSARILLESF